MKISVEEKFQPGLLPEIFRWNGHGGVFGKCEVHSDRFHR